MPRIVPLQLLKCLKVLLDDNGGILSESEVKRIAGLMTKYSKKLVSKCIYVQILKCTKTELLGEFMGAGGWTLVHMWLNDGIRAMNWPLVQEILELLLLCPVDVDRLKSNSAPKLVRGLCKEGGNEGVRILAKRLVEQWLKVVTADSSVTIPPAIVSSHAATTTAMPPQTAALAVETPAPVTVKTEIQTEMKTGIKAEIPQTPTTETTTSSKFQGQNGNASPVIRQKESTVRDTSERYEENDEEEEEDEEKEDEEEEEEEKEDEDEEEEEEEEEEKDPLADVPNDVLPVPSYGPTPAQKKASEAGLVYKIVVKDGHQVLTKVDATTAAKSSPKQLKQRKKQTNEAITHTSTIKIEEKEENLEADEEYQSEGKEDEEVDEEQQQEEQVVTETHDDDPEASIDEDDKKAEVEGKEKERKNSTEETTIPTKPETVLTTKNREEDIKKLAIGGDEPAVTSASPSTVKKDGEKIAVEEAKTKESPKSQSLKENGEKKMERKTSKDSKETKDKEKVKVHEEEKNREHKSSSSSNHKSPSSSNHKSSSSSHKSSSRSSSSKPSKSSSSSNSDKHTSDKHRSSGSEKDRDRSSSSKDKDRSNSSSSSGKSSSSSSKSSSSSSSGSKERSREKDREKRPSSSLSKKDKEDLQAEKDKTTLASISKQPSIDKLGKIPKKPKPPTASEDSNSSVNCQPTSITIPSKKSSISIEIRRDSEKAKTVKTYKSQFRSHGLTEEAPPPPSRKGLKKPTSAYATGTSIPLSLPSSIKRNSPTHNRELPAEKKTKIDINSVVNNINNAGAEKPGSIKLIPPKKISTLIETNIFSDALSAATGPKKPAKRKRPTTPKEAPSPPTSPETPKVAPLKFYQDTLDESKDEASTKEPASAATDADSQKSEADSSTDKDADVVEDDDDIPLKKVKEDIEQQVLKEQKAARDASKDDSGENAEAEATESSESDQPRKPGPGCGPNGPPGVLTLHRRKGPKKKLSWRPEESLEQIRYFELDETERVNVTKTFMDMKNMERFSERDAINMSRRGFNHDDNMEPQTTWKPLIEVDDVPPHPNGNQSKERRVQAEREQTTLRALYFSHSMIPDSPAEPELEPHYPHDIPVIPLDDITGNPDAVNDFTSMRWPEPKGSPKDDEGTGASTGTNDVFNGAPFNPFLNTYLAPGGPPPGMLSPQQQKMSVPPPTVQMVPPGVWPGPNGRMPVAPMSGQGNQFNNGPLLETPSMDVGPMGPGGPMVGLPPNFMGGRNQFGPPAPPNQFGPGGHQFGPPPGFNGPPNFGPMGHGPMMGGMGPAPIPNTHMMNGPSGQGPPRNSGGRGGNWRSGGSHFSDSNRGDGGGSGGGGGGNWRSAGSGQNRNDWTSNGICKSYLRGHCRQGKSCKYTHPAKKSKRL